MQPEIVTTGLSILTGTLGYAIRERQNYSKPVLAILSLSGSYVDNEKSINIEMSIVAKTQESAYIDTLQNNCTLKELSKSLDDCLLINTDSSKIVNQVDIIIKSIESKCENKELFDNLSGLLQISSLDNFIAAFLIYRKIDIIDIPEEIPVLLHATVFNSTNKGCYVIDFPGKPATIGAGFSTDGYWKAIFDPIVNIITRAHRPGLLTFLNSLKIQMNKEMLIASDLLTKLQDLKNNNSSWKIYGYIANLKKHPILLQQDATLYVEDITGAKFVEKCTLLSVTDNDSESVTNRSDSPLIIPSGEHKKFEYCTLNVQSEMKSGDTLREVYKRKQSKAWIEIEIQGIGFISNKKHKTPKIIFAE